MLLYPSIDILDGKVVRLRRGDFAQVAEYPGEPVDYARRWQEAGADFIHVVDLDGAVHGEFKNFEYVRKIIDETHTPVQLGGGVRTIEQIKTALDIGVSRVIVGTRAVDKGFVKEILSEFSSQIAIGMDVRDGLVQTHGWKKGSGVNQEDFLNHIAEMGASYGVWTDISKDGMLQGPNIEGLKEVLNLQPSIEFILSGGMANIEDVKKVLEIKEPNFNGTIIGRALYEDKINLKEAVELVKK